MMDVFKTKAEIQKTIRALFDGQQDAVNALEHADIIEALKSVNATLKASNEQDEASEISNNLIDDFVAIEVVVKSGNAGSFMQCKTSELSVLIEKLAKTVKYEA